MNRFGAKQKRTSDVLPKPDILISYRHSKTVGAILGLTPSLHESAKAAASAGSPAAVIA